MIGERTFARRFQVDFLENRRRPRNGLPGLLIFYVSRRIANVRGFCDARFETPRAALFVSRPSKRSNENTPLIFPRYRVGVKTINVVSGKINRIGAYVYLIGVELNAHESGSYARLKRRELRPRERVSVREGARAPTR